MEVITLSLGREILEKGSREYERMRMYAAKLEALHIIVLTRSQHGYAEVIQEENLFLYPTNSRTRAGMLIDAFRIGKRILNEGAPRTFVVSAQDPLEIGWLALLLARQENARLHIQVHGDYFGGNWVAHSPLRLIKGFFALRLLRRAPAIRVVSERIKRSLIVRGIPEETITVLPIRPEIEAFLSLPAHRRSGEQFTFLYVGRLAPEKDVLRIVRAFAILSARESKARLKIVGRGEEEKRIREAIDALGIRDRVACLPWTARVGDEMASADALVLASQHEAYGLVLLEAMAAGLPAVTTDVGCVGEVFKDGVHGIVVHAKGDRALAEAMEHMCMHPDLWKHYAQNAKEAALRIAEVTPEAYAYAWVNALQKSLAQV